MSVLKWDETDCGKVEARKWSKGIQRQIYNAV